MLSAWPGQPLRLVRPWPDIKSGYQTVGACMRELYGLTYELTEWPDL